MSGTKITLKPLFLYEFNNNNDNNENYIKELKSISLCIFKYNWPFQNSISKA